MSQEEEEFGEEQEESKDEFYSTERRRKVGKKMDDFMGELAEDMIPPAVLKKTEKKILELFKSNNIPVTVTTMRAYAEGFVFGMISYAKLEEDAGKILMGIRKMILDMEGKKPHIDITKSKPLPPDMEQHI